MLTISVLVALILALPNQTLHKADKKIANTWRFALRLARGLAVSLAAFFNPERRKRAARAVSHVGSFSKQFAVLFAQVAAAIVGIALFLAGLWAFNSVLSSSAKQAARQLAQERADGY